jgi:hypothetical protein
MKISGEFDVSVKPLGSYAEAQDGITLGHMSIDKTFQGELAATSKGEMLSALTPVKGSAGYVAIEQVVGRLSGRSGSFVLQYFGTMDKGKDYLILEVVPDSGTNELQGLSGKMAIIIKDGKHTYEFDYQIASSI